jgi:dipeptidase E
MRDNDLLSAVKEFIGRGGKVFGGSAGALILGADIGICDVKNGGLDENDIGMEDTSALGLLGSKGVVYPHFQGVETKQHGACQRWADEKGFEVIATPERCGVSVDGERVMMNAGPADVFVYSRGKVVRRYGEGERWKLE